VTPSPAEVFTVESPLDADESEYAGLVPLAPLASMEQSPITPVFNADLALVRSVVEAVGGGSQVCWAAAVVEAETGRQLVVTTDRGRWLPAAAVLPADAVLPWSHPQAAHWEGLRDPARVIVEYTAAVGGHITALASTYSAAPAVAAGVPWVFADASEQAHPELVGGEVVTRFELQVVKHHRAQVAAIGTPVDQRAKALWVALDADTKLGGGMPDRRALIDVLSAGAGRLGDLRWVTSHDWGPVEAAYQELGERQRTALDDCRDVPVGEVDTGSAARELLAQLCATEALLAVRNPVPERAVRDAVYAWTLATSIPRDEPVSPVSPANAV
jgi:hypothetical protein